MLAPFFPPAVGPDHYNNGKLALSLLSAGHDIRVITRRPTDADTIDDSPVWRKLIPHTVSVDSSLKMTLFSRIVSSAL